MKQIHSANNYLSILMVAVLFTSTCVGETGSTPATSSSDAAKTTVVTTVGGSALGVGDLVEVDLFTSPSAQPEFSSKVRVGTDGTIQLPLLGAFHVAGLSLETAQSDIAKAYQQKGIYRQAQLSLVVIEYGVQHSISVSGEVQKPGVYPMNGAIRLVDAIALAGGLTNRAGLKIAIEPADSALPGRVVGTPNGAPAPGENPVLSAGDKVIVERAGIVYVIGDVNKPGGFVMDNTSNVTVLQSLALAEGVKPTASLGSAKIIRTTKQGRTELPLQLKKIMAGQMPDPQLQPEDIVVVPQSTAKVVARRTTEAAIYTVSGLAIYGRL